MSVNYDQSVYVICQQKMINQKYLMSAKGDKVEYIITPVEEIMYGKTVSLQKDKTPLV